MTDKDEKHLGEQSKHDPNPLARAPEPSAINADDQASANPSKTDDKISVADVELQIKQTELAIKKEESKKSVWGNPLIIAILGATLAGLGNAAVAIIGGYEQIALADRKAEQDRMLEMLKTGDPDKAATNLQFLLDTGLLETPKYVSNLKLFLKNRRPGQGPALAAVQGSVTSKGKFWANARIPVCWENPSAADAPQRDLVRSAVAQTWEANSQLRFIGWKTCAATDKGLRIQIDDSAPRTLGLGTDLDGMVNGIVLNFTFDKYSPVCKTKLSYCVTITAVHVFGHAIGLAHEQNRPDAPPRCSAMAQGPAPEVLLGPYDPDSVMNYCNPKWLNDGKLSAGDIAKVKRLYGGTEASTSQSAPQ